MGAGARDTARADAESGSKGPIRVRHAGALGRSDRARARVRTIPAGGESAARAVGARVARLPQSPIAGGARAALRSSRARAASRSEEHTSELQSPCNLVCRLLLEKKNK